ncbi:xanthine dehydrogenase family protein molybdopterin-binding subunit [Planctomyces sp. SH-PL62]|uniref:xanthine dehydrogenase family protein molybdopterin-binding subunit n=1 Tax=Planctomyces sp. SH-PL62 TaxID=1636152 RepID=UPI00078BFAFF|nr:molybdopterin cofactor-binding domain-containing protein [Planctomyces sp. SH-PL62]AMV38053.1 Nicotinate dehydrogenase subunit B [Planctomyces sp. SH-PL62]
MKAREDWKVEALKAAGVAADYDEAVDLVPYRFDEADAFEPSRRGVLKALGAGLLIAVAADAAPAKAKGEEPPRRRGGGRGGPFGRGAATMAARLHLGEDGSITVMTGKVECGQGARMELAQAAAEELRVPFERVQLIMGDTEAAPDDGGTYGSLSTPATVPAIRLGCASARELLAASAARRWDVDAAEIVVEEGRARHPKKADEALAYADLARDPEAARAMAAAVAPDVALTPVSAWKVLGRSIAKPTGRDIVTGAHVYPSDVVRPGMLHGKVLRAPRYGASLTAVDLAPARAMPGVVAVRDGDFVGVAAPTAARAQAALDAIAKTAEWTAPPHPSSEDLPRFLREHAQGGLPDRPIFEEGAKGLKASYDVAYIQHVPMEPRAAVAEWEDGKVTAWVGTQTPFPVRGELARAFGLAEDRARVIVPDFGGGFGGKHSGEYAVEAARLAKAAGKPVRVVWTRAEEFAWAQFRPAAAIEMEASLDAEGRIATWRHLNVNSGGGSVQTPYRAGRADCRFLQSDPPLRHGSYRALASTANTFARESFMDELAALAGRDPLAFRLANLDEPRLRDVLAEAASRFGWEARSKAGEPGKGVGLACGLDKGGFVAACVAVSVDRKDGTITVDEVCQVFDCGKILNPENLRTQVEGAIVMGLGPALTEAIAFQDGMVTNGSFRDYRVPHFADLPRLDVHLLDRPDAPSSGAGETPIIAVAPAVANAVFAATGVRVRAMPIRLPAPEAAGK